MTTIAWDGKIIATDSRSSSAEHRVADNDKHSTHRICLHCERPAWNGSDNAVKLLVAPKVTINDEAIVAMAGTGSSDDCKRIRTAVQNPPAGLTSLEAIWESYCALGKPGHHGQYLCKFLVVTEKNLYVAEFGSAYPSAFRYFREDRTKPYSMGSGGDAARMALLLGRNAVEAVWAARAVDPGTGGAVRYFDITLFTEESVKEGKLKPKKQAAMTREEALAYMQRGFVDRPNAKKAKDNTEGDEE